MAWPASGDAAANLYSVLLEDGRVVMGRVSRSDVPSVVPGLTGATCMAWSPDGSYLAAGHRDSIVFCASDTLRTQCTVRILSSEAEAEEGDELCVRGMSWMARSAILVASQLIQGE